MHSGMSAEKPSVRVSLDLTGYEEYFKQAAKLKQDIWPDWGKTMSQHEPQGHESEGMIVRRSLLVSNNA